MSIRFCNDQYHNSPNWSKLFRNAFSVSPQTLHRVGQSTWTLLFFFFFFSIREIIFFVSCYGECVTDMITSQLISNTYSGMVTLKDGSFTPMNIEYSACMHVIHNRKMNITTIFRIISLFWYIRTCESSPCKTYPLMEKRLAK